MVIADGSPHSMVRRRFLLLPEEPSPTAEKLRKVRRYRLSSMGRRFEQSGGVPRQADVARADAGSGR